MGLQNWRVFVLSVRLSPVSLLSSTRPKKPKSESCTRVKNTSPWTSVLKRLGLFIAASTNIRKVLRLPNRPLKSVCSNSANLPSRPDFPAFVIFSLKKKNGGKKKKKKKKKKK